MVRQPQFDDQDGAAIVGNNGEVGTLPASLRLPLYLAADDSPVGMGGELRVPPRLDLATEAPLIQSVPHVRIAASAYTGFMAEDAAACK